MGNVPRKAMRVRLLVSALAHTLILAALACSGLSESGEHYNAGVALQQQGRLEDAVAEYDQAIRLSPQFADAYLNRGLAYIQLEQYERAVQGYDEAIRLNPQDAGLYNNRGNAYEGLEQYERAIQDYDEAIRLNPRAAFYRNRGLAYIEHGDSQRAILDLNEAIRLRPDYMRAFANRARAHGLLGNDVAAYQDGTRALELGLDPALLDEVVKELMQQR